MIFKAMTFMNIKTFLCGISAFTMLSCESSSQSVQRQNIVYADPTVVLDGDTYYMTGTGSQVVPGFTVLMSKDLHEWTTGTPDVNRFILNKGNSYGDAGFWAPQWFQDGGAWYLAYTADEQTALAKGGGVTGPFRQYPFRAIDSSEKNIDPFLFKDDDGKYYLYYVRFNGGNYIWAAEFDMETGTVKADTRRQCLWITEAWENTQSYPSGPVMEGPTVVKLDGVYYLFYSANHYMSADYAVGYATASSPMGPWTKYKGNPVISRETVGENGSGHGDFFRGKDGQYYYVYHVHNSETVVNPRYTRIVPLHMSKAANGIYNIAVSKEEVIVPYQTCQSY